MENNYNKHIEDYLNYYLKDDKSKSAILINGKWGSGKTYFINEYIKYSIKNTEKYKFIRISLFGLNNTSQIDDEIFTQLHPILGSKKVKLMSNIIKSGLKFGFKFDLDGDNKSDGTTNIDLSKLSMNNENQNLAQNIFIFDDLERTTIPSKELLGYINNFVEILGLKVIIIADETKLEKKKNYLEFKEKVIGATFTIQHDIENILKCYIEELTKDSTKYLKANIDQIIDIYQKSGYDNIRHIQQTINDFEFFYKNSSLSTYNDIDSFMAQLIDNFFILSIEMKHGSFTIKDLLDYKQHKQHKEDEYYKNDNESDY